MPSADQRPGKFAFPTADSLCALLKRIPALVWATDLNCQFTSLAGAGLHALALEPLGYIGKPVEALFSVSAASGSEPGANALECHRNALRGVACSFDAEVRGRNLEAHLEALRAPDGSIAGVVGLALDGTDRLLAEKALRISEQSYRSLVEEAPYGICRVTESGQFLQANRALLEMLGYGPESEADLLVRDLPQIFASSGDFEAFREQLARNGTIQGLDGVWLRRDGSEIRVRIGARAIRGQAGELFYFDLLAENVTEKRELEARLQQAQKIQAIGHLAGGIAHDFNNLLTVINGYCDMLLERNKEDGADRQGLAMIRQAGERATGLTRQLLTFSRKQISQPQPIHLNTCVAEILDLTRRLIGENIVVVESFDPAAGTVLADAAQMNQMLMNLVINARDAMAAGGRIDIVTSCEDVGPELAEELDLSPGKHAVLRVTDTGVGMDERVRAHLFEPFFTTKPAGRGTGLGLSTVYGIVRQARGAITVDSRPGAGTTFRIYLPRLSAEAIPADSTQTPETHVRGASTILVVEDEAVVRRFVRDILRNSGHHVLEAANADEALAIARRHRRPIHLLLTDMVMPGPDGRELAERLKCFHPESKVVLVSGYSESLTIDGALGAGIHFLPKPFTPHQLTALIKEVLSTNAPGARRAARGAS